MRVLGSESLSRSRYKLCCGDDQPTKQQSLTVNSYNTRQSPPFSQSVVERERERETFAEAQPLAPSGIPASTRSDDHREPLQIRDKRHIIQLDQRLYTVTVLCLLLWMYIKCRSDSDFFNCNSSRRNAFIFGLIGVSCLQTAQLRLRHSSHHQRRGEAGRQTETQTVVVVDKSGAFLLQLRWGSVTCDPSVSTTTNGN